MRNDRPVCGCADDEGGTPRAKYDRLRVPLVAVPSLWDGDNRQISKACIFRKQARNIQRQSVLEYPLCKGSAILRSPLEDAQELFSVGCSSSLPQPLPSREDRAQDRPESCPGLETQISQAMAEIRAPMAAANSIASITAGAGVGSDGWSAQGGYPGIAFGSPVVGEI